MIENLLIVIGIGIVIGILFAFFYFRAKVNIDIPSMESRQIRKIDKLAQMRHSYASKFISKYIPWYSRVLDIGVGGGGYWSKLRGKYDVVGVDLNPGKFVDYVLNVEKDSLEKIGEKFHFVTMFDVIEHLENPISALRNIRNVMEKDGLFIGSTPNRFDPYLFVGGTIHPDHNYVFDKLTIQHLLRKCGFKTIEIKNRVLPIKLSRNIFISVDLSKLIPVGRVVFWIATPDDA